MSGGPRARGSGAETPDLKASGLGETPGVEKRRRWELETRGGGAVGASGARGGGLWAPERMRKRKERTDRWRPGPGFSFREGLSLRSAVGPRLDERTCLFLETQGCPVGRGPGSRRRGLGLRWKKPVLVDVTALSRVPGTSPSLSILCSCCVIKGFLVPEIYGQEDVPVGNKRLGGNPLWGPSE